MKKVKMLLLLVALVLGAKGRAQEDSLQANRYVMSAFSLGAGHANVLDTYLSPLEYEGPEVCFLYERMRMTRLGKGNVSVQHLLQGNFYFVENPSKTADMYGGLLHWSCAFHYQFPVNESLKLLAGPVFELNAGGVYNNRNSNNPAQARAYGGIAASGMAIYKFRIGNYPLVARYQALLPLAGVMFSPEFGESYYEIFSLGNGGRNVLFTSLHNNPSVRQMLTLDFPIRNVIMRMGYVCDIQQAKVNHLKNHTYSHVFMVGFVKNFFLLKGKNKISMPHTVTPY